jgi:glycosyltransferase involved in cell wall biosynthesis
MISYIVASHDERILNDNLLASLDLGQDQLIIVNEKSIAIAYNRGLRKAKYKIKCFIHHDIFIKNSKKLRQSLITHCKDDVGIVGVIGSKSAEALPWWSYDHCGSAFDARMGEIYFSAGNEECALLDGIMLATAQDIRFDESYPGYHMYDHDICRQAIEAGWSNFCLPNGSDLIFHNTKASSDVNELKHWNECVEIYKNKWSVDEFIR